MTFSANLCKWYIERVNEALFLFTCLVIHLLVIHLLKKQILFEYLHLLATILDKRQNSWSLRSHTGKYTEKPT